MVFIGRGHLWWRSCKSAHARPPLQWSAGQVRSARGQPTLQYPRQFGAVFLPSFLPFPASHAAMKVRSRYDISWYRQMPASLHTRRSSASCSTVNLVLSVTMFSASHAACRWRFLGGVAAASTAAIYALVLHSVFNPLLLSVPFMGLYCRFYRFLVANATGFSTDFSTGAPPRFFVVLSIGKMPLRLRAARLCCPPFFRFGRCGVGGAPSLWLGFPPPLRWPVSVAGAIGPRPLSAPVLFRRK